MEYKSFIGRLGGSPSTVISGLTTMFNGGSTRLVSIDCVGPETAIKSLVAALNRSDKECVSVHISHDRNNPLSGTEHQNILSYAWPGKYNIFTSYLHEINKTHLIAIARLPANSFALVVAGVNLNDKAEFVDFVMRQTMQRIPIPMARNWQGLYDFLVTKRMIFEWGSNHGNQKIVHLNSDINRWIDCIEEAIRSRIMEVA